MMTASQTILVVDDDAHIRDVVCFALDRAGFHTLQASDGLEALALHATHHPALVVLDILMPELDGTEVCRRLRQRANTPVVFLTSCDDEIDRIVGLEMGGDDYVTKPFSPRELTARVKAVLRRARSPLSHESEPEKKRPLEHGRLALDTDRFKAFWDDVEISLTVTEFGLLRTLLGFPGKVYSRAELMRGAYDDLTVVSDRTIDSHIRRVRQKFGALGADALIKTVHGVGYTLDTCR